MDDAESPSAEGADNAGGSDEVANVENANLGDNIDVDMDQTLLSVMQSTTTHQPTHDATLPASSADYAAAIASLRSLEDLVGDGLTIDINKKYVQKDVAAIVNQHGRMIGAVIQRTNQIRDHVVRMNQAAHDWQSTTHKRICSLEAGQGCSRMEEDSDEELTTMRTPAKRKPKTKQGPKKRATRPKPDDQNRIKNFIHFTFHDKIGKAYAEVKGYQGWRVLEQEGIVKKWPHPVEGGACLAEVNHGPHPTRPTESIMSERSRPDWTNREASSSDVFVKSVVSSVTEQFPAAESTRITRMVDGYWNSASARYLKEWDINGADAVFVKQKRLKSPAGDTD